MKGLSGKEKLDIQNLNKMIKLGSTILKMLFVFLGIIGLYAITMIFKEWRIFSIILTILKVLSPFFIGLIIAWLLAPCVEFLHKRGINKILGTVITYIFMIGALYLFITTIFPLLLNQINDFIASIPAIFDDVTVWLNSMLDRFRDISFIDVDNIKSDVSQSVADFVRSLTTETPAMIVSFIRSLMSAVGIFALGLMVGFYLLFDFNNVGKILLSLFPRRVRGDVTGLFKEVNSFLFKYVKGTLLVSLIILVLSTIAFIITGLKAPLLFGLICGITNIIPYIGPYLGGAPAVIVAFSQGTATGVFVLIAIAAIQFVEGNFIQPLVMSKTMKLHPVTIILGLLIFGYFFGVVGMIIATPMIATIKSVLFFFEKKYNVFKFNVEEK